MEQKSEIGGSRYQKAENPLKGKTGPASNKRRQKQKEKSGKRYRIWLAAMIILVLVVGIYAGIGWYYGGHFYKGTLIYGMDCSLLTSEEVKQKAARRLEEYQLTILERNGQSETITAEQIQLTFEDDSGIDTMLHHQYAWAWPLMQLQNRETSSELAFSYDREMAEESLQELQCLQEQQMESPQDAYLQAEGASFVIVPEKEGTTLDYEKTREAIFQALDEGRSEVDLEEEGCYLAPLITSQNEELNQELEARNAVVHANITLDFGDRTEVIDAARMEDWLVKTADGDYVIDDTAVVDFVQYLADTYDTYGIERAFHTTYDTTVYLYGGDYGWMLDQTSTLIAIMDAITEGYEGVLEPVYDQTGSSRNTDDIGGTYIEICISTQTMMCYVDGELYVTTPVVTGNPNKGNGTPSGGVWKIDDKLRNFTLVGEDYRQPVDYWMPFNGNVGIHDLQSRAYFGSTIYLYAGSHGCVNTPYWAVSMIYDAVSVGTPVIVYETP